MSKKIIKVVCVNAILIIMVLLLFEIGLRVVIKSKPNLELLRFMPLKLRHNLISDPKKITKNESAKSRLARFENHDELGWLHPSRSKHKRYKNETTEEGFHTPNNPKPHKPQLIVIGDSFLEGIRIELPLAWRIQKKTGEKVLNLSAGGWGPGSYLAAYNLIARHRNVKAVILFSFINDVGDAQHFRMWEKTGKRVAFKELLFNKRWYNYSINKDKSFLDQNSCLYNLVKYILWQKGIIRIEKKNSKIKKKLREVKESVIPDNYTDTKYSPETVCWDGKCIDILMKINENRLFLLCSLADLSEGGICHNIFGDYFYYMEKLFSSVAESGHELLLVWIPTRERVYFEMLDDKRKRNFLPKAEDLIGAEFVIENFAKQHGIKFIDLTDPLIAAAKEQLRDSKQLYGPRGNLKDGHFNALGSEIVATLVHRELVKQNLLVGSIED